MGNVEMSFVKQGIVGTRDWDAYQALLRGHGRMTEVLSPPPVSPRRKQPARRQR